MKVFISESVCGGGWHESVLPPSLAREGGAMLQALCADFAQLSNIEVTTTVDRRCRLTLDPSIRVTLVTAPAEEEQQFLELAAATDVTVIIAPELGNLLARRITAARSVGAKVIAPSAETVELCSDKLRLAPFLIDHNVPTIPTASLADDDDIEADGGQFVVKPRFGAGSQDTRIISPNQIEACRQPIQTAPEEQRIVQPLIGGFTCSIGALFHPATDDEESSYDLLPVAAQRLSDDGHFRYLGGQIPWEGAAVMQMHDIVRTCHRLLPDFQGYVGFDFLADGGDATNVVLVEINPRLCTSYLGYRQLTDDNLAARMLSAGSHPPIVWKSRPVCFQADGSRLDIPQPETV